MALRLKVELFCDGCGSDFPASDLYDSASIARAAAKDAGWDLARFHNVLLEICPSCQVRMGAETIDAVSRTSAKRMAT